MKCGKSELVERLKKKAAKSPCRYKISAIGIDHRGRVIASATNLPRFPRKGGGLHAEQRVIKNSPRSLSTIVLVRLGLLGEVRPIEPCARCKELAAKLGIKIITVEE